MTPEKRAQLQRLKELVGRMEVEKTPRKGFTPKQRQAVWDKQDGLCAGCGNALGLSFDIDHRVEIALGGKHEPDNFQGMCKACHSEKTKTGIKAIAKVNRIRKREAEGPKPSRMKSRGFSPGKRKLQSRGFPKKSS